MKKYSSNPFLVRLINSKIFIVLILFLLVGIGYAVYNELDQQRLVKDNIKNLQAEKEVLENVNLDLAALLKYYKSDEYVETEARQKLNMARVGEHVVIVPDNENVINQNEGSDKFKNMKNWELWVEYFFGNNKRM